VTGRQGIAHFHLFWRPTKSYEGRRISALNLWVGIFLPNPELPFTATMGYRAYADYAARTAYRGADLASSAKRSCSFSWPRQRRGQI